MRLVRIFEAVTEIEVFGSGGTSPSGRELEERKVLERS